MQSVSSRIWTRNAVFISYGDNDYTTGTSEKQSDDEVPVMLELWLVGLVSLFNGISTLFRLFNAKAILLEQ